jgi:hypothetical protein
MSIAATTDAPADTLSTSQILVHAIEMLSVMGWTQEQYIDTRGRVCAYAAIISSSRDDGKQAARAGHEVAKLVGNVPRWNDAYTTTFEEVISVLTQAAKNAMTRENIIPEGQ